MKQPKKPFPSIWLVYLDGEFAVWCTSKIAANKYRKWGRLGWDKANNIKHKVDIFRYNLDKNEVNSGKS